MEEIRNMINSKEMPLFVQEIWTILINFLLRAKHESLILSKIFEDIAICLFDRKLFENEKLFLRSFYSKPKKRQDKYQNRDAFFYLEKNLSEQI